MVATCHDFVLRVTPSRRRSTPGDCTLNDAEAFALGYVSTQAQDYLVAARMFKALASRQPGHSEFPIMLACCQIAMKDYQGSTSTLQSLFADAAPKVLDGLQAAFVFESLGMWDDAIVDLRNVAESHPEIPLLRLLLGDLYAQSGASNRAVRFWKAAVELDGDDGLVAYVAKSRLRRLPRKRRSLQELSCA